MQPLSSCGQPALLLQCSVGRNDLCWEGPMRGPLAVELIRRIKIKGSSTTWTFSDFLLLLLVTIGYLKS